MHLRGLASGRKEKMDTDSGGDGTETFGNGHTEGMRIRECTAKGMARKVRRVRGLSES